MNQSDYNYSVFVPSTDSYKDTWDAFFMLFKIYWPEYNGVIYLSTETEDFSYPGLNIHVIKIGSNRRYTWSECLLNAINQIDSDYVLFILDDLFLDKRVNNQKINSFVQEMIKEKISLLYLTNQSTSGPFIKNKNEDFYELTQNASYRIGALIALWDKTAFSRYVKSDENPWEFEIFGTKRASLIKDKVFCVNTEKYNGKDNWVISHTIPTGITRGKWNDCVFDLFEKHSIKIDYSKRGIYKDPEDSSLINKVKRRINFRNLRNQFNMFLFRIKCLIRSN